MKLKDALGVIHENEHYKELLGEVEGGTRAAVSAGGAVRPYLLAALAQSLGRPMLVVTANSDRARRLAEALTAYTDSADLFVEVETMPYDSLSPSPASVGRRLAMLDAMRSGKPRLWVASIQTAMRTMVPVGENVHRPLGLRVGDEIDLYALAEKLVAMGYARVPLVENHGEFSLRGGIIDIFAANAAQPVRVELFGDEVDSIRSFSVATQRSTERAPRVDIYGCRQLTLTDENVERALGALPGNPGEWLEDEIGKLKDRMYFEGVDKYLPFLYEDLSTVLDYLPAEALVVVDEPEETLQVAKQYLEQQLSYIGHLIEHGAMVPPRQPYFVRPQRVLDRAALELTSLGAPGAVSFAATPIQPLSSREDELISLLREYIDQRLRVVIAAPEGDRLERVAGALTRAAIPYGTGLSGAAGVSLATGDLAGGFASADIGLAVISFADIFGRKVVRQHRPAGARGQSISDIADLKVGDYVVHSTHGIAVYGGLQRREIAGIVRDYALLEYAGNDRLFVPIDQLDRITRYIGAAGEAPPVSRLGGTEWLKAKRKASKAARKVAYDLLALYAERANVKGCAFSADTPWQKELEDSFKYDETPDQLVAIEDVKADMEGPKPMDRLICGDVGYGKTEVAVRAAFKAVMDGKQVMVLVPTTILAQQHYMTFSDRLGAFPVKVEMVSRFKSPAKQKEVIAGFNKGAVDVLIGTHRLLQSDVKPFNLGLVIIDEEQRFGVNDKEKLRNFKKSVDVLTLSATPIPRTLQMSLAGVRDMSVIETPPEGRHPIVTHVGRYDEEMLIQAIRRELGRGGQVYYVHNRVETIDRVAGRVQELIPEARVAIAHGQMGEHQLEKIMLGFLDKDYDVLVCTTIIESGIDIPSVNTLIVDRAELLGLAQLYQLRGRIGRSSARAYAYFFFSPQRLLTEQAFERLKTIGDFTELGSGIKIALRDLEIRGAGNLLGGEQHGHMSAVGFELYCQMLRDSIEELEGKPVIELQEVKIDLPVNAYLPDRYITEESLRIEAYQKVVLARETDDIERLALELKDRYGAPPEPVQRLLDIAKLRLIARQLGITEIAHQNGRVRVSPVTVSKQQEMALLRSYSNLVFNSQRHYLSVTRVEQGKIMSFLLSLFGDMIVSALSVGVMVGQKAR